MAMDGHDGARFDGVKHSLAVIVWCSTKVVTLSQARVCLGLGRESIEKLIVNFHWLGMCPKPGSLSNCCQKI